MEPSQEPLNPPQTASEPTTAPAVQPDAAASHQEPSGAPAQGQAEA